jgi:hypothetical protein
VISSPLLVILGLGALSASLQFPVVADVFAVGGAVLGVAAFVIVALATVRSARRLPARPGRR